MNHLSLLSTWRTRSVMYGVYTFAQTVPDALRELARQLELEGEEEYVADLHFSLEDEGYVVGALIEKGPET